jgi:hypothetical protein
MSDDKTGSPHQPEEPDFNAVPDDFPCPIHHGALPGAQSKFLVTEYRGRFYVPGSTPPEVYERWEICEDLAEQLAQKSLESKAAKRAHMTKAEILEQYLSRLIAQKWTSEAEARWIIRRVAQIVNWPIPPAALEPSIGGGSVDLM